MVPWGMMPRPLLLVAVALGLTATFLYLRPAVDDTPVRLAEENAAVALRSYRATRDSVRSFANTRDSANKAKVKVRLETSRVAARADSVSDSSRVVIANADTLACLPRLAAQVAVTDSLAAAFRAYVRADIAADSASDRLIATLTSATHKADTALVRADVLRRAERAQSAKRVRTAFVVGITLGVITRVIR